jgi:hypothetical protein
MLTVYDCQLLLENVTYRPGWAFTIKEHIFHGPQLVIDVETENTVRPGETIVLNIRSLMPDCFDTPDAFYRWLFWRIRQAEIHEAREWFKVTGKMIFDPHDPEDERNVR